jgi:signal transduction histidine kinase
MSFHASIGHCETFRLRDLVEEVQNALEPRLKERSIETVIDVPSDQMVEADRELLGRAVRNLMLNAIDAMPKGGSLVATSAIGLCAMELEIADSGLALSEEERRQAFEPLAAAQRGGTCWGLAVVQRIAKLHGGSVAVANCPEGGVAFTLRLPRTVALEAAA